MDGAPDDEYVVDFPTLGFLIADWVERHCIIPDGFRQGKPFAMYEWQLWCTVNHYRVRPDAQPAGDEYVDDEGEEKIVTGASAFHNRRSLVIAPQKAGKGPWSATIVAAEAVGPVLFDGWAEPGDVYRCADHGCPCGWVYAYEPGEPRGKRWPKPLIQLVATAETQTDNVYRPLQAMARGKMLSPLMQVTEGFIRLPNDGRIDVVTSNAQSKLGNPIIFALQDESGLYTDANGMTTVADTQQRGCAGMGGRSMETSNAHDPTKNSTCQRTLKVAQQTGDIFVFWQRPPDSYGDYLDPVCRRKIHRHAYKGCKHVNLDDIEATAVEMILKEDPRQAERFFGNRDAAGSSKWITPEEWDRHGVDPITVGKGEQITLGFDGSDGTKQGHHRPADSTVLRACRLSDGYRWTVAAWEHPTDSDGRPVSEWWVPRDEVLDKIRWCFGHYDVVLAGFDPPYWQHEVRLLTEEFGDDRIVEFRTAHDPLMASALLALKLADTPHDRCPVVRRHALNAVTFIKEHRDDSDQRKTLVLVRKPLDTEKIDGLISDAIANDMRDRAIAAGARKRKQFKAVAFR